VVNTIWLAWFSYDMPTLLICFLKRLQDCSQDGNQSTVFVCLLLKMYFLKQLFSVGIILRHRGWGVMHPHFFEILMFLLYWPSSFQCIDPPPPPTFKFVVPPLHKGISILGHACVNYYLSVRYRISVWLI